MDLRFSIHNSHLDESIKFESLDPHLRVLKHQPFIYQSKLLEQLPKSTPGIYTLGGGRQLGKTTLLKQWMLKLLKDEKRKPQEIIFLTGEIIDDHHSLINIIQNHLKLQPQHLIPLIIIIDEVTYIKDWDKGIKFLADAGLISNCILILTGSDLVFLQEARMRFPGRRGTSDILDFHFYPLSFAEFINLKFPNQKVSDVILNDGFMDYLIHGGVISAINQYATTHSISSNLLSVYADWIRGNCIKYGKNETFLREIITAIFKCYNSQVTWNSLGDHVSINHPQTIHEYALLLERMDCLFIQHAILEDKLLPAPKKAKKLFFCDPFIFHALRWWVSSVDYSFESQIDNPELQPALVETCVVNHFQRKYPTYYIKAEGEVDIAFVNNQSFTPIELKWRNQLSAKELKQVKKYQNAEVWHKGSEKIEIAGVKTYPLVQKLYEMG